MGLDRDQAITLVAALLAVLALGVVAATLGTAVEVGGDQLDFDPYDPDEDPGMGDEIDGDLDVDPEGGMADGSPYQFDTCIRFFTTGYGMLSFVVGIAGVLFVISRRWTLGMAALASYVLVPIALVAYFMVTNCPEAGGPGVADGRSNESMIGDLWAEEVAATPEVSPAILVVLFALALLGVGAVLYSASRDEVVETVEDIVEEETDVADLAAAAGRAADRLQHRDADVDNAVYEAWVEMTQLLAVPDPETATAGEFAAEAIDVGMDRDLVDELTTLFEEVRYGHAEADEEREELAIDLFRRIEERHGIEVAETSSAAGESEE